MATTMLDEISSAEWRFASWSTVRSREARSQSSSSTSRRGRRSPPPQPRRPWETIYGLEGVLTWTIEGTPIDVGPGQALLIPRGAVRQFENTAPSMRRRWRS